MEISRKAATAQREEGREGGKDILASLFLLPLRLCGFA
jgi:hypothetical protein